MQRLLILGLIWSSVYLASAQQKKASARPLSKVVTLAPLTPRERALQLLDRFTYGPRPGEVDRVLAQGTDQWFEQQLDPDSIPDPALAKRLKDYPTLNMTPAEALAVFPDRAQIRAVQEEKAEAPDDPLEAAVYAVQLEKANREKVAKTPDLSGQPRREPTEAEKAEARKRDQATASRLFGELIALPKQQRMNALIALPVDDRIVLTGNGNLIGEQRNLLFADFNPRERETFQAMSGQVRSSGNIANELAQARILRDILSERQLQAVMTDFWFNHFNIYVGKDSDQWYTTCYERDVIRKHALGSFRDLLLATAQSPAMMVYLDNFLSIGPDSLANGVNPKNPKTKRGNKGLNENYGREVMELHTVGVNGGYTQADVTALSAILTGWGVDDPQVGGPFAFEPRHHEPGPKTWLGYTISDTGEILARSMPTASQTFGPSDAPATPDSIKQGIAALNILAASPKTAHFISTLIAQYFVTDTPPQALVDHLTATYLSSNGDIKTILRTLIASPEFNSRQYFHTKVKTPVEFIASSFRATGTEPTNPGALVNTIKTMGMPLYYALPPTGYYLTADQWMNSTALVDRLNFSYQLTTSKFANQKFDSPKLLALGLMSPGSSLPMAELPAPPGLGTMKLAAPKLTPVANSASSASTSTAPQPSAGSLTAMRVLEFSVVGAPVSAKTNQLISTQLAQQPATASPTDTLNLLTALILGSPEFQLR